MAGDPKGLRKTSRLLHYDDRRSLWRRFALHSCGSWALECLYVDERSPTKDRFVEGKFTI